MPKKLFDLISDSDNLLSLEPEELAGVLLELFNSPDAPENCRLNRYNFCQISNYSDYPKQYWETIGNALMEAWMWLEREGLIAPKSGIGVCEEDEYFITRRGKQIKSSDDFRAYQQANLLPKKQLHPRIAQKVWATFYEVIMIQQYFNHLRK